MTALSTEPFLHPALLYRGPDEYLAGTVPFVREGLAAGEPVAVAVPGGNLRSLRHELRDVADRVSFIDMEEAGRNPGRIIPGVLRRFADAHPGPRVRIIGEPIWRGRTAAEYPACVQHEALINRAFTGRALTVLCPYDVGRLDPEVVDDARTTHPTVIEGGDERPSAGYAPDRAAAAGNRPLERPPGLEPLAFDAEALPWVRAQACAVAGVLGLGGGRQDDLALAVSELTTNSVLHGGGSGSLCVWDEDGSVVVEIRDRGRLTDPLVGRRPAPRDRPHGRGLLMVHHLADLVRVHTGENGTTFRAHFRI